MGYNCYGHYPQSEPGKCAACLHLRWCKEAADPPLMLEDMGSYDETFQDQLAAVLEEQRRSLKRQKFTGEMLRYSRSDLLEMMVFMLNLNPLTLQLLSDKIGDPDLNFSEIARNRRRSRQAVQQAVRRKILENPELAPILNNRERATKQRKQYTFLEAVCQIRRKMSAPNSPKPVNNLNSYRNLNCWNRNFDLSKMSMLKGSRIFPAASAK